MIDYEQEKAINNKRMDELMDSMFPGINIPHEYIFNLLQVLGQTQINAMILPKVIRGVNNILIGTGKGQVIVHVQRETMNVSTRETDEEMKCKE